MATLNDLSQIERDKYWELVDKTLKDIFHATVPSTAAQQLKQSINKSKPDNQVLFYHSEPLSIVSEIAGKKPTLTQIDVYRKLRSGIYGLPYP